MFSVPRVRIVAAATVVAMGCVLVVAEPATADPTPSSSVTPSVVATAGSSSAGTQASASASAAASTPTRSPLGTMAKPRDPSPKILQGLPSRTRSANGCGNTVLPGNDDGSSGEVSLPFDVKFYGRTYSSLWVNNNGNVTFDGPMATYVPFDLSVTSHPIIAPFFADVDTRQGAGSVTYGQTHYEGDIAFCVSWNNVGYYNQQTEKRNTFRIYLVKRGSGFDIIFEYVKIEWDLGSASGGVSARVGYSDGNSAQSLQLSGSAENGTLLDGGSQALTARSIGSSIPGIFVMPVRGECMRNDSRNVPSGYGCESNWWEWPDTDTDGIPDYWERNGVYVRGQKLDLATAGARVGQKDIFLYVQQVRGERWNAEIERMVREAFQESPQRIKVHFLHADLLEKSEIPSRVNAESTFVKSVMSAHSSGSRSFKESPWSRSTSTPQLAKYIVVAPDHEDVVSDGKHYPGISVGGESMGIPGDALVVTMNEQAWESTLVNQMNDPYRTRVRNALKFSGMKNLWYDYLNSATVMHELGHLLGLSHHGKEDKPSDDPKYHSVMSYSYCASGVPVVEGGRVAGYRIDYSGRDVVNNDWRMSHRGASVGDSYGKLTLVRGQWGEVGNFYSLADDVLSSPAPQSTPDLDISAIARTPGVAGNVANSILLLGGDVRPVPPAYSPGFPDPSDAPNSPEPSGGPGSTGSQSSPGTSATGASSATHEGRRPTGLPATGDR